MRGDNLRLNAYVKEYGYDFVITAIEKAIELKDAAEMRRGLAGKAINKANGEARILNACKALNVRLGSGN